MSHFALHGTALPRIEKWNISKYRIQLHFVVESKCVLLQIVTLYAFGWECVRKACER